MGLVIASRSSESPWISSVWASRSAGVSQMTSIASETWGLVFWECEGRPYATVTGPEERARAAPVPGDARFFGIQFAVGTVLRKAPTSTFLNSGFELPDTTAGRFWLDGERWQTPRVDDDAEALVARLVRGGVLVQDPLVRAALDGRLPAGTTRTVERRFRHATGLTRGAVAQIERARAAADLLAAGEESGVVVGLLGYYDEPHLARALRRYVGRTAGQLRGGLGGAIALSQLADDVVDGLEDAVGVGGGLAQG
ncbi:AraC family transcriptional regulator [Micromonospora fluostatini]|uniref:AraC family transcriptional regulator n=1 Tax=Micromonospora fluostatini TaxID=1629071 RepID=A0ABY2DJA2_9ACTN|nr:AraC family transcriptional regulator [Micromonospora fluostatini]